MVALSFIAIVVSFVINYFVAKKFEEIAFQKGYDASIHSFAMCFWLGITGYLYVIALPELKDRNSVDDICSRDSVPDNSINEAPKNEEPKIEKTPKEKYDQLVAKAEKFKDTFYDRSYRIRVYESIVRDMETLASENFEDSVERLNEYKSHLELLKTKKIK